MLTIDTVFQYACWLIALLQIIIGLYILHLYSRHTAGWLAAAVMLASTANSFSLGSLVSASSLKQAYLPALLFAASSGASAPLTLLAAVSLLRPHWLRSAGRRGRWVYRGLLLLAFVTPLITLIDALFDSRLYFSGLNPLTYRSGFVHPVQFLQGALDFPLRIVVFAIPGILTVLFLLYAALFNRSQARLQQRLAVMILLSSLLTQAANIFFLAEIPFVVASLLAGLLILAAFAYAAYNEVIIERLPLVGEKTSSLVGRMIGVVLIVSLPLIAAMGLFLTNQARNQLEQDAVASLAASNRAALESVEVWLSFNVRALKNLTQDDNLIRMNPSEQEPVLRTFVSNYPYIYLASTTNLHGINVARSDGGIITDYSDRSWFKQVASGQPISYQVVVGRTSGIPALVVAIPIRNNQGETVGVGMFASELTQLGQLIAKTSFARNGEVFLVDDRDYVLTHTNPEVKSNTYYHDYPAVQQLRQGKIGLVQFTDAQGDAWRAQVNVLTNGWGLIVQQKEETLLAPIRAFISLGIIAMLMGAAVLLLLVTPAMRQGLRPVRSLTETAAAITRGDLARLAPVESQDELGVLADAFNSMTAQLRDLISGLEARVSERTRDVERRAAQLQVTSEVARETAAIHDPEQLLNDVTRLISERLGHYHVGIFLIEGTRERVVRPGALPENEGGYAVLKAANSEGGQQMLARGHRLKVGQVGIVGYVASAGRPRIALDVGRDAIYFNNPDLPLTRSEVALPLKIQNQVVGVLDVQSKRAQAFSEEDLSILQILADQVALAIENARLIAESRKTVQELESLYGMQVAEGWQRRLGHHPLRYRLNTQGVTADETFHFLGPTAPDTAPEAGDDLVIDLPIELRGHSLGRLHLKRSPVAGNWTHQDRDLLHTTLAQLAQSLENARLLDEIQNRARQEEQINQIVARAQSSLNLETVMRTAVRELGQILNASKVRLQLGERTANGRGGRFEASAAAPEQDEEGDAA